MKQTGKLFDDFADCLETLALSSLEQFEKSHLHAGQFGSCGCRPLNTQGFVGGYPAADAIGDNVDSVTRPGQVNGGLIDTDMCLDAREEYLRARGTLQHCV